jgi:hypothetical protein
MPLLLTSCVIASPSPGTNARLNSVAAVDASNAWAVGDFFDGTGEHELLERWNGQAWQEVFLPPPIGRSLSSVTAVSGHQVVAVGDGRTLYFGGSGWRSIPNPAGITMQKVAHGTDGTVYGLGINSHSAGSLWLLQSNGWHLVSALSPITSNGCISAGNAADLSVVKAKDVWIVGGGVLANSTQRCTVAMRWDGTVWHPTAVPQIAGSTLNAVSAVSDSDVWTVGITQTHDQQLMATFDSSLALHWNGSSWSQVSATGGGFLSDVVATPQGVWAVGTNEVGAGFPVGMAIAKWDGKGLALQPVQHLVISGAVTDESQLSGVALAGGVVTSVGSTAPKINVTATLTERRNAN